MRRILTSVGFILALTLPCQAQGDKAKPNTLTPREIADGWILLFDGETTFGWKVNYCPAGTRLKVTEGALDLTDLNICFIATTMEFAEFELRFEYKKVRGAANVGVQVGERGNTKSSLLLLQKEAEWTSVIVRLVGGQLQLGESEKENWKGATAVRFGQSDAGVNLQLRNIKHVVFLAYFANAVRQNGCFFSTKVNRSQV